MGLNRDNFSTKKLYRFFIEIHCFWSLSLLLKKENIINNLIAIYKRNIASDILKKVMNTSHIRLQSFRTIISLPKFSFQIEQIILHLYYI